MSRSIAVADHRRAVNNFVHTAEALSNDAWHRAVADGKWSPAEIAEHLNLTYAALLRELAGGSAIRIRTSRWQRWLLRWTILPRVLRHGRIPPGVRAVREVRPGGGPFDRAEVLGRLRSQCEFINAALGPDGKAPRARVTHPFFGKLDAQQALRFCTVHAAHHQRQLPQPAHTTVG
jgi:hypothetical protein